jgi:hypothetical protein
MNRTITYKCCWALACLSGFGVVVGVAKAEWPAIDFSRDIRPILSDNCFKCHGPDEGNREADLRLDTEAGAFADLGKGYHVIAPGDPAHSEMIWRIELDADDEDLMPPPKSNLSLSADEKRKIRQWIAEGAEWRNHWAFEPVSRPPLPQVSRPDWAKNEIDYFVLARLEAEGFRPSPVAERATLVRRLSLDLTGLPPTLAEVEAFLVDESPEAYERLVDRLLASPHYGEAMALPWLEAARYADTDGYQNDGPRTMWRWRDWVIDAYNRNLPFDQFTVEQLAGDLLEDPSLDQIIATGFNRNHRYNSEAGLVFEEFRLENAVDRVDTTSTVWMGMTVACARCHDHKYDPFSQKEYYQLVSLFDNIPESGRAVKFRNSEPWVTSPSAEQAAELQALEREVLRAEENLGSAAGRIDAGIVDWVSDRPEHLDESKFMGRGLIDYFPLNDQSQQGEGSAGAYVFEKGIRDRAIVLAGQRPFQVQNKLSLATEDRFSVALWLKPDDVVDAVVLSRQTSDSTRPGTTLELKEGRVQFYIISRWIAGVAAIETVEPIEPNTWTHLTLTNDGSMSARGMHIWVNGIAVETRLLHNSNSNFMGSKKAPPLRLGGGVEGIPFRGRIDELRLYDRTLDQDEAALLAVPMSLTEVYRQSAAQRSQLAAAKWRAYYLQHEAPDSLRQLDESLFDAKARRLAYHDSLPTTMIMREMANPPPTHVRIRGVYNDYGEEVTTDLPEVLPDYPEGAPRNRLGFAQWLVSGDHPLTARVAGNRYWIKYFGRGLVQTAEDFGLQGDSPSHAELLDWLADEFVRLDWDVKAMQKLIVMSATYRQQSRVTPELIARDPENVWLARGPRQRLSAQTTRDQALALSGLLVDRMGGPSVSPYQPEKLWETMSNMKYSQSEGEDLYRRSLYTIWKRTVPPPTMALLDAADRESCMVSPRRTNTPLQALVMLNEKGFVEAARNLGQRILMEGGESAEERVVFGFRTVTARAPHDRERALLAVAYDEYRRAFKRDSKGATQLIGFGDSPVVDTIDSRELAAATTLANLLLNLDEVISKE